MAEPHCRAARGGHDVSDEKITQRYHRALPLLPGALTASYRAYLFDNSGDEPVWLAEKTPEGSLQLKVGEDEAPAWFKTHVLFRM